MAGNSGKWTGRHRAPVSGTRKLMVRVVAPLVAVAVVVAVIVVLVGLNGHSSGNNPGPGVITASSPSVISSQTPTQMPSPSLTPSHTLTPRPTHTKAAPPTHPPASLTAMASVRVYNSTRITGLAHHVAAEIEARGWSVVDVGNVGGASSLSTLYYAPGDKAAAQHLAREFSGIRQVEPDSAAGISFTGLTLILTADWHD